MTGGRARVVALSVLALMVALGMASLLRPAPSEGVGGAEAPQVADEVGTLPQDVVAAVEELPQSVERTEAVDKNEAESVKVESPSPHAVDTAESTHDGVNVFGVVRDPDGKPIEGAGVWTRRLDGTREHVMTDAEGAYSLGPLDPGRWLVSAGKRDHFTEHATIDVQDEDVEVDFELRPQQRITVRLLRSSGAPTYPLSEEERSSGVRFQQVVPVATRDDPGPRFDGVVGSLNNLFGIGRFRAVDLRADPEAAGLGIVGTVTIEEDVDGGFLSYVASSQVVATQPFTRATESVVLTVDPSMLRSLEGTVTGQLIDPTSGAGVLGEVVWSTDPIPLGPDKFDSAPDGTFRLDGMQPGEHYLIATAEGHATVIVEARLEPGAVLDLGDVSMPREVKLSGTVIDADGNPTPAHVMHGDVDANTGRIQWHQQNAYLAGRNGRFSVSRLAPGRHALRVDALGDFWRSDRDRSQRSRVLIVDVESGELAELELRLEPTTPVTIVQEWPTEPWPVASWVSPDGTVEQSTSLGRGTPERLLHLCRGTYTLRIELDGAVLDESLVTVGSEPQRIEVGLEPR